MTAMEASAILVERKARKEAKSKEAEAVDDNRTKYTIMIDKDILNRYRHIAIDKETTVTELLNEAAKSYLKTLSS